MVVWYSTVAVGLVELAVVALAFVLGQRVLNGDNLIEVVCNLTKVAFGVADQ